jgi:endonuclease G
MIKLQNPKRIFLAALTIFFAGIVSAHPGGVNKDGCHTNRKTGEYHCHGSSSQPSVNSSNTTQLKPAVYSSAFGTVEPESPSNLIKLDYDGFTVWLDCSKRAPVKFRFNAQHDTGNFPRYDTFMLDPDVPSECQQKTSKAYGMGYDRGHQVNANVLDSSWTGIRQSNYMTNILPQASQMNRGAWLLTEEITECYRDIDELLVIGGVIWGNNPDDDYFLKSHGVKTPDAFWKVIIRGTGENERAIAWVVPNTITATKANLDKYLVSVAEIERVTGEVIPVADYAKHDKPSSSWVIPYGCDKS